MTPREIARAYLELSSEDTHYIDVIAKLAENDELIKEVSEELSKLYIERENT